MQTHANTVAKAVGSTRSTPAITSGLLMAALTLMLAPHPASASRFWNDYTAAGNLVDVSVQVQGHSAPLFLTGDARDRFYFQAFKGRNYALSIHNRSGERVGVLIAVDGLNVVNGERSGLSAGEPMYVLGPWESAVIRGWRTSLSEVRQFVFVDEERSYAERTGQANGDMGWIRVLSFRENRPLAWGGVRKFYDGQGGDERGQAQPTPEAGEPMARKSAERDNATRSEVGAKDQLAPSAPENFPGTGWGERRGDPVRRVQFNPMLQATDHLVLRYEYESGLRALGIFPDRRYRLRERESGQMGFAQPPRW
jgi:hypothetical protein